MRHARSLLGFLAVLVVAVVVTWSRCASSATAEPAPDRAVVRLVVLVSIDQFPHEYLDRMREGFEPDGIFLRMLRGGAAFTNCRHNHAFTFTGPGHSVMLTGAAPALSGIVGNDWFDRNRGQSVNCVEDPASPLVGAPTSRPAAGRSPRNQLVPTVGDVLKLHTAGRARVYGVSVKDRAAILTAGDLADAAYWFDTASGRWVTSRHYREALPEYLESLNASGAAGRYAGRRWELLYEAERYHQYRPDDSPHEWEAEPFGRAFPHALPEQAGKEYYSQLRSTPFANELTLEVARLLVEQEELGKDDVPDLLIVGLSANDYVGHSFGPYSLETQDMTYRTDRALGEFTDFLNEQIGEQWSLIISSDHGIAPVPEYAAEVGLPAVRDPLGDLKALAESIEKALRDQFGVPSGAQRYVQHVAAEQVYLNRHLPELEADRFAAAQRRVRDLLLEHEAVAAAFTREQLLAAAQPAGAPDDLLGQFALTFHPSRSGDVLFALRPYTIQTQQLRTTHGSPWQYDRHVVLLLSGPGIRPGIYPVPVSPAQIAPTVAGLLGIDNPPACMVEPLHEAMQRPVSTD